LVVVGGETLTVVGDVAGVVTTVVTGDTVTLAVVGTGEAVGCVVLVAVTTVLDAIAAGVAVGTVTGGLWAAATVATVVGADVGGSGLVPLAFGGGAPAAILGVVGVAAVANRGSAATATECAGFMRNAVTMPNSAETLKTVATIRPPAARWRVFRRAGRDGAADTVRVLAAASSGAGSSAMAEIDRAPHGSMTSGAMVLMPDGSMGQEVIGCVPNVPSWSGDVSWGTGAAYVLAAVDPWARSADRPRRAASAASLAARSSSVTGMSPPSAQIHLQ
jgi:hypothetical protein